MKKVALSLTLVAGALALAGCSTPHGPDNNTLRKEVSELANERAKAPAVLAEHTRVVESDRAYIPLMPRKGAESAWLRAHRVDVQTGNSTVPLSQLLQVLSRQGINITSELPLDHYSYSGFSLTDMDAETALRTIVSASGLDYTVDAARQLVTIKPMSSRTWYLSIGNRKSSYASGTENQQQNASSGSEGGTSAESTGRSQISSADDFWESLRTEMEARLTVMVAEPPEQPARNAGSAASLPLPPMVIPLTPGSTTPPPVPTVEARASADGTVAMTGTPPALVASPSASQGTRPTSSPLSYVSKTVGSYAANPETGAVTVQAPHWILEDLEQYFKRVQEMYNTDLVFQGELLLLTTDSSRSEGIDISSFATFANQRYGVAFRNNALGGVTLSFPNGNLIPAVAAGQSALSGPLVGITSAVDGLQLFSAYLTNLGRVTSLQKPVLTTTSGVPADFRRTVTRYFNTVSQQAAAGGNGGAAVGTQNKLIAQDFGTILRVNPRIDVSTGLIRAQIELVQTSQAGVQNISQALTSGDGVEQVTSQLPIVSKIIYSGEALLRDGDLIVMGGQTEEGESMNRDGITHAMDSPALGGLFGKTMRKAERNVFYFALRVNVNRRN